MDARSLVRGDCVMLSRLAWDTLQGSKDAVGENDELTRELLGLYRIISRLQTALENPTSVVNRANDERRKELEERAADCEGILKVMNTVLGKYNGMGGEQRRRRKLWQTIQFGNGETKDLKEVRNELSAHTSAITMGFNLCTLHSPGRVETTLEMAEEQTRRHGRSLRGIKKSLHWVIANLSREVGEGSVRSSHANDDKIFWRTLRKELVKEGYDNYTLQKHRRLIKAYVEELVNRGVLDDQGTDSTRHIPRPRLHKARSNFYLHGLSRIDAWSLLPPEKDRIPPSHVASSVAEPEDVDMADVSSNEDEVENYVSEETAWSPAFEATREAVLKLENSENSDLSSSTLVEEINDHPALTPFSDNVRSKIFAVQVEDITDEEIIHNRNAVFEEDHSAVFSTLEYGPDRFEEHASESSEAFDDEEMQDEFEPEQEPVIVEPPSPGKDEPAVRRPFSRLPPPVQVEDILDDDFAPGAHPNVFLHEDLTKDLDTGRPPIVEKLPVQPPAPSSGGSMPSQKGSLKRVRWAEDDDPDVEQRSSPCKYAPEDLPFIFHREFRDFDKYQELQESSQALREGQHVRRSRKKKSDPSSRTCSFITQKEYIPPATLGDLQYYRIPASYFHKFWHPARVPMYLHGNVFDGISFTHWIFGWTAYTFRDESFEMSTMKRFGKHVIKLGSAMTDIENADYSAKRKIPRPLYDESGRLWAELENIVNDIMSESEDRLAKKRRGGRLEAEFVTRFCKEMIAGDKYYRPIERWLKQTDDWCKKVRFHKDFVLLWNLWAV
jgi:hypothetical protein